MKITVSSKAIIQNVRADKVLPRQGKAKGSLSSQSPYMKCQRDVSKKKKIKTMNIKMTTNSQLSTTEPKKTKTK